MINNFLFLSAFVFLAIGLCFIYKPTWLVRINKVLRDRVFNDNLILLERRRKGVFFLLLCFFFAYGGYYRSQYARTRISDKLISTDRLLYQSLQHLHKGEYEKAEKLCNLVLSREPENSGALYQMGAVQLQLGNAAAAENHWSRAKAIDPHSAEAQYLRNTLARQGAQPMEVLR